MAEAASPTIGELAANRAALYRWFAQAFFEPPSLEYLHALQKGEMEKLLQSLAAFPEAKSGVAAMERALSDGPAELVVSTLGAAFVRIFDGLGGPQIAPPYRSFYENDKGLLCQQATAEMDHALHQHRMRLADDVNEPSDHLAIQLELMSQLALRLGETASSSQRPLSPLLVEQQDFLATHLLGWVPRFAERLALVDSTGYYAGLAAVLQSFLEEDRAYLASEV